MQEEEKPEPLDTPEQSNAPAKMDNENHIPEVNNPVPIEESIVEVIQEEEFDEDLLNDIAKLSEKAQCEDRSTEIIAIGQIRRDAGLKIQASTGVNVMNFNISLSFNSLKHAFNMHGSSFDKNKGQRPITTDDVVQIPNIIKNFDTVRFDPKDSSRKKYHDSLVFTKKISTDHTLALEIVSNQMELRFKTLFIKNR